MRALISCGVALAVVAGVSAVSAAELESGLQVGQKVGAFQVVKCSGAVDDGIEVGKELCYR